LLALLGAHHIFHVSRIRVNLLRTTVHSRLALVFEHNTLEELLLMPSEIFVYASNKLGISAIKFGNLDVDR
jgi:hypothetical protein